MKAEDLTMLALRVVAVIIGAYACVDLSQIAFLVAGMHVSTVKVSGIFAAWWSVPMIVALLLWWLAPRLARLACRGKISGTDFSSLNIERLTHGAFVVVGVCVFLYGLADLARLGFGMLTAKLSISLFPWNYFTEYALRCIFGIVLILGGRGLSRVLLHLRTAGREHEPSS
ncbi:MAG: hypothetical protein ACRER1_01970 [Gammaproteobacteria bacterium]